MTLHLLALETSSSLCGVALLSRADDGAITLNVLEHDAVSEHAERMLPMVDQLLAQAGIAPGQLSAVAFGQGPGGFTGLRVACGVAQGMGFSLNIPVIPVASLLAVATRDHVALSVPAPVQIVVQDARMGEIYLAAYQAGLSAGRASWNELQAPVLLDAGQLGPWLDFVANAWGLNSGPGARLLGDALQAYPELTSVAAERNWLQTGAALRADASSVARLALQRWEEGGSVAPELAAPLYVRDKVAYTTLERQAGAGGNPRAPEQFLVLERMQAAHLDVVAGIEAAVQAFPWTRGNFADGLNAGYDAWVAMQSGAVVGFSMSMFAPDVAHLLVIAVDPGCQSSGVGTQLLRRCEQEAIHRGLPAIVLEVRLSNENALRFYRHRGFEQIGMRKGYYPAPDGQREDACVMQKRLA